MALQYIRTWPKAYMRKLDNYPIFVTYIDEWNLNIWTSHQKPCTKLSSKARSYRRTATHQFSVVNCRDWTKKIRHGFMIKPTIQILDPNVQDPLIRLARWSAHMKSHNLISKYCIFSIPSMISIYQTIQQDVNSANELVLPATPLAVDLKNKSGVGPLERQIFFDCKNEFIIPCRVLASSCVDPWSKLLLWVNPRDHVRLHVTSRCFAWRAQFLGWDEIDLQNCCFRCHCPWGQHDHSRKKTNRIDQGDLGVGEFLLRAR